MDILVFMGILEEAIDSMDRHRKAQCRFNALRVTHPSLMHAGIHLLWSQDQFSNWIHQGRARWPHVMVWVAQFSQSTKQPTHVNLSFLMAWGRQRGFCIATDCLGVSISTPSGEATGSGKGSNAYIRI